MEKARTNFLKFVVSLISLVSIVITQPVQEQTQFIEYGRFVTYTQVVSQH